MYDNLTKRKIDHLMQTKSFGRVVTWSSCPLNVRQLDQTKNQPPQVDQIIWLSCHLVELSFIRPLNVRQLDQTKTRPPQVDQSCKVGPICNTNYRYFGSHRLSSDMPIILYLEIQSLYDQNLVRYQSLRLSIKQTCSFDIRPPKNLRKLHTRFLDNKLHPYIYLIEMHRHKCKAAYDSSQDCNRTSLIIIHVLIVF